MLGEFFHCIALTTRIPLDRYLVFSEKTMISSLLFLPLSGAVVGFLGAGAFILFSLYLPKAIVVVFVISLLVLLTGAFEEDAFADSVDGFGGGATKKDVLRIMRDSRIGTYGTLALIGAVGMEFGLLFYTPSAILPQILFFAFVGSRFSALPLIWGLPYINDSSSFAKAFSLHAKNITGLSIFAVFLLVCAVGWALFGHKSIYILFAVWIVVLVTGWYYNKRLGGITGDCLGATLKIAEIAVLFFGVLWT